MTEVIVDTDALAHGLEQGLGALDGFMAAFPEAERLNYSRCGLTSAAIQHYAMQRQLPVHLLIASPSISAEPYLRHVLPVLGERTIIDATYRQFLGYVGLIGWYEKRSGRKLFPDHKVLVFDMDETDMVVDWLTQIAVEFRDNNQPLPLIKKDYGRPCGSGPLRDASVAEIHETFANIYDISAMQAWRSTDDVDQAGIKMSSYIPGGAIVAA